MKKKPSFVHYSLFAVHFLFLTACTQEEKVPEGTLSEQKMSQIMVEIHLIEARVSRLSLVSIDSTTLVTEQLKRAMFKKLQVDTAAFNRSYKFYATNPELLQRIYEPVVKHLERRVKKDDVKGL
jgi:tRNA/tmRNA/rRNA uracil-C5-methylase (TrmA/RlmC/RlmD family)